jgi:carboxyl-terminal processing protease
LARLAATPTPEGRLAQSYLKQEDLRRFYDRKQKNLLEYAKKAAEQTQLEGSHEARLLENTMRLIETTSLEGEKQTREKLVEAALDGMLRSLDEHSSFLSSKSFNDNFAEDLLDPEYGGIGAYVGEDPEDGLFTIRQPIYSGPAYKMGLQSEDKIVRIEDWPTYTAQGSKPLDDIIKRLKGKPGTAVKLYIWRRGMDNGLIDRPTEEMAVTVTREKVTIPPMKIDLLPGGLGLIQLDTFSGVAAEEVAKALGDMKQHGLKAVVLDLRQNTGGLLTQARDVANLFLPKGKLVVSTESRSGEPRKLFTMRDAVVPAEVPVVVLVSRFSASASEIVAGALQDHQRAVVVGQRSYGKGSVQELLPIPGERDDLFDDENNNGRHDNWEPLTKDWNGNGEYDFAPRARLTVARYRLPSGRSIHRERGEDGTVLSEGGVDPSVKADPQRLEPAVITEMRRVLGTKKIRDWLDKAWKENKAELVSLAACDFDDPRRYPRFDELYASLETTLSSADVRDLVRREVRGRAQDARGSAFPDGDFQDDPMLQAAIESALERLNTSKDAIPEYAATFDERAKPEDRALLTARLSDAQRRDLRHALTLLGEGDRSLGAETMAEIRRALQAVLDR